MAEYEALLHGLRMAKEMNIKRIRLFGDSDLVAQQVSGTWDLKDVNMAAYRRAVDQLPGSFPATRWSTSIVAKMRWQMHCQGWDLEERKFHQISA